MVLSGLRRLLGFWTIVKAEISIQQSLNGLVCGDVVTYSYSLAMKHRSERLINNCLQRSQNVGAD